MTKDFTIQKILLILSRHLKLIVLVTVVATLLTFIVTKFYINPVYSSYAIIQVSNFDYSQQTQQSTTTGQERVYASDLTSSSTLADYCTVLFLNSPDMSAVLEGCSLSIDSENETNFLRVTVSGDDPAKTANVANAVAKEAPKLFEKYYKVGSIETLRPASVPSSPSSPNVKNNVLFGFAGGLIFAILLSLFLDIIDTTIKPDDDLFKIYGIPVFAEIVDFEREEK